MAHWVGLQTGHVQQISVATNLQHDLGLCGDDMDEFLDAYAQHFKVDLTRYRWYFHLTREEGWSIGQYLVRPPYRQVEQILVTIGMLTQFANSGTWSIDYPLHRISKHRYDIWIDTAITGLLVFGSALASVWAFSK